MDATTLHQQSIVIDGHCDTLMNVLMRYQGTFDRRHQQEDPGHIDLPRLKAGGVTAQNFACYLESRFLPAQAVRETLRMLDAFYRWQDENATDLRLATCAADIEQAKRQGQVAGILSLEGAEGLEGDLGVLRMMYRLGVRWVGLTWNHRNQAADGLSEARSGGGLTEFGVKLVQEMNRLGMIVDIAHLAPAGVDDVFEACQGPVVASHANARALCSATRNLTDAQLEKLARSGGVIGVVFVPQFITDSYDPTQPQPPTLDMLIDHIDYIVKQIGIDYVGLGSDFDGFTGLPPVGLPDAAHLPNLTTRLLERGYAPADVSKILGGNWLRVIRQTMG